MDNKNFGKEYFLKLEKLTGKQRFIEEMDLVYDFLPPKIGDKILDSCCGTGRLGLFLLDKNKDIEVVFSDISPLSADYLQGHRFVACSAVSMPFADEYFDKIYCLHAISHVEDTQAAMREFYRVTKKEGKIIVITPNKYYVYTLRLAAFLKLIPSYKFDETARWLFGAGSLKKMFNKSGWKVTQCHIFGSPVSKYLKFNFLRWHILMIGKK